MGIHSRPDNTRQLGYAANDRRFGQLWCRCGDLKLSITSAHMEEIDALVLSDIARVLLVDPVVPMLMHTKAPAPDAVAFGIIDCLRRRIMSQGGFAQVVISILDIRKIRPFGSQKIKTD